MIVVMSASWAAMRPFRDFLDHEAFGWRPPETLQGQQVDIGCGLLGRHDVARKDQEVGGCVRADGVVKDGPDRWLGGCRAHRELPAGGARLTHDPGDARPSGEASGLDHRHIAFGLPLVPLHDLTKLGIGYPPAVPLQPRTPAVQ